MLRRGVPVRSSKWIWVNTILVLLALTCVMIVMSRNGQAQAERSPLFWNW